MEFVGEKDQLVQFDLIIALEHFEHIPDENIDQIMSNITKHSNNQTQLILSISIGKDLLDKEHSVHCNIRSKTCWLSHIKSGGFQPYNPPFVIGRGGEIEIFALKI